MSRSIFRWIPLAYAAFIGASPVWRLPGCAALPVVQSHRRTDPVLMALATLALATFMGSSRSFRLI